MQKRPLTSKSSAEPKDVVPVVLITYATTETIVREALDKVVADGMISGLPQVIRIERE